MLDAKQKVIGIARIHDPDSYYGWYWTTDFGSKLDSTSHAPGESPSEQGAFRNEQDQVQKPERGRQGPSNAGVGRNEDRAGIENGSMEKDGVWKQETAKEGNDLIKRGRSPPWRLRQRGGRASAENPDKARAEAYLPRAGGDERDRDPGRRSRCPPNRSGRRASGDL
jgi:hypothetical protein